MKRYHLLLQVVVLLCVPACEKRTDELHKTESIKITYTVTDHQNVLTVSDAKKVKEIVEFLQIKGGEKGLHFGIEAFGTVTFTLKGGAESKLFFVDEKTLEGEDGRIDLKDKRFYDKINKILSDKEGRKIDILKDN